MHNERRSHRHLVAAPLLAVALLVLVAQAPSDVSSKGYEEALLEEGSALLSDKGLIKLTSGEYDFLGMNGAFFVSLQNEDLSVAALSSPVLVRKNSKVVLLPVGHQWRSSDGSMQNVPEHFLKEKLREASQLDNEEISGADDLHLSTYNPSIFMFPEAMERQRERWAKEVVELLRIYIEQDNDDKALDLLDDPEFSEAFSSKSGHRVLALILADLPNGSDLEAPILSLLLEDKDIWLVASIHPAYRARTWTLASPETDDEEIRARLSALPQSDAIGEGIKEFTMRRWVQAVRALDDPAFAEELIFALQPLVGRAEETGFPQRARRLAAALQEVGVAFEADLSMEALKLLLELDELTKVEVEAIEIEEPSFAPSPFAEATGDRDGASEGKEEAEATTFDAAQAEARAHKILTEAGALFTVNTRLQAVSADTVHIKSIIFGDRLMDFDLNVRTQTIGAVQMEGERFPYEMKLDGFVEWAKK